MEALHDNGIDYYSHLMTGYIASTSFLTRIQEVVKHLKKVNPKLLYGRSPQLLFLYEAFL